MYGIVLCGKMFGVNGGKLMKFKDSLQELIDEFKIEYPEEWEKTQQDVKEWSAKVKSGEITLDVKPLYFDEDGNLKEIE